MPHLPDEPSMFRKRSAKDEYYSKEDRKLMFKSGKIRPLAGPSDAAANEMLRKRNYKEEIRRRRVNRTAMA